MDLQDLRKFISQKGFKTLTEVKEHFKAEDQEIVAMHLDYLNNNGTIKKVYFTVDNESNLLYYIPGQKK